MPERTIRIKYSTNKPFLSVIIPLFNEERRLRNLTRIHQYLSRKKINHEIIVVNDGSTDKTIGKLKLLKNNFSFQVISYPSNKGKGHAIKTGVEKAKGKYRLFTDIDLSTPIEEMERFLPFLGKYAVIIGSRRIKGAKLLKRQPFIREVLGKSFTRFSNFILKMDIADFTCGFKLFSEKAAKEIFRKQKIQRWGFDAEILYLAKKLGFSIKEVPVKWSNDSRSRVKFPQAIISSLIDLYKIKSHF